MKIEDLAKEFKVSADQIKEAIAAVGIAPLDVYAEEHKKAIAPIFTLIAEKKANSVKEAAQQLPKPKEQKKDRPLPEIAPQPDKDGSLAVVESNGLSTLFQGSPDTANELHTIAEEKAIATAKANVTGFVEALSTYDENDAREAGAHAARVLVDQKRKDYLSSPEGKQQIADIIQKGLKK